MSDFIYGRWPVLEALRAHSRNFQQLLLVENIEEKGIVQEIATLANQMSIKVRRVPRRIVDDIAREGNHQGVVLRTGNYRYAHVDDILSLAASRNEKPFLLLLDLLKDPQNVGVVLRIADAVGVHGVIMQERRGVGITPSVVAASAGASEHLKISQVTNLVSTMKHLKEQDTWLVGFDIDAKAQPIDKIDLDMAVAIVLGSEGDGMRRLVRESCDLIATLPMRGNVASLNVATVGSIALYAAWQARSWEGWQPTK